MKRLSTMATDSKKIFEDFSARLIVPFPPGSV
jgi:hypothetical protein